VVITVKIRATRFASVDETAKRQILKSISGSGPALRNVCYKGVAGMKRRIVRVAARTLMTGALGLAGLGLATGTAQAQSGLAPQDDDHWCAPFVPCDWWQPDQGQPPWLWQPPWWRGGQGDQGDNQQ
jgi:hypothetical protein